MRSAAGGARAGTGALLEAQKPFDLGELGVVLLQQRRAAHEHIEAEVVADRHLVREAAEVPVEFHDLLGQLIAAAAQRGARLALRQLRRLSREGRPAPFALKLSAAGESPGGGVVGNPAVNGSAQPVEITLGRFLDFCS